MDDKKTRYEIDDHIATITISDTAHANVMGEEVQKDIMAYLDDACVNEAVHVVILRAEGRLFSAGGDVGLLKDMVLHSPSDGARLDEALTWPGAITRRIRAIQKPVVAAIQGALAGAAANVVLACDFRIAAEDAFLLEAFVNIGLSTDGGGAYLLSRMVGAAKATELIMLGKPLKAAEAMACGLLTKVVPSADLEKETCLFAARLASGPQKAYRAMKRLINQTAFPDIECALTTEVEYQRTCVRTSDCMEGMTAFLEKRKPDYQGK